MSFTVIIEFQNNKGEQSMCRKKISSFFHLENIQEPKNFHTTINQSQKKRKLHKNDKKKFLKREKLFR